VWRYAGVLRPLDGRQRGAPASWNPGGLSKATQTDWDGVEQLGHVSTWPSAMAGSAWPCSGLPGPRLAVASSPEHLGVQWKRGQERGKTEECGAVLATVTLNHGGAPVTFGTGGGDNAALLGLD
jgi:hypothetical protein